MTLGEQVETRCIACREVIQPDARICPHCRSAQSPDRWKMLGAILKWVGGTAAIISLLTGMVQVNGLFSSWRSRQEAVTELVKAARLQGDAGDYAGAWKVYEQALQIEPGSRAARDGQDALAMRWLRDMRISEDQTFSQLVDPLLPALYRAAANENTRNSADALAHIGWANYLKNRDFGTASSGELAGPKVEEQFRAALKTDPGNVYAHAMWGFWVAYRAGPLSEAGHHFSEALKRGRERQYVRNLQVSAYLNREVDAESDVQLVRLADEMRRDNDAIDADYRKRIVENVYLGSASGSDGRVNEILSAIPPADHLATLTWLVQGTNLESDRRYRFYHARLSETAGDRSTALTEYKALQSLSTPMEHLLAEQVALGIQRISAQSAKASGQR